MGHGQGSSSATAVNPGALLWPLVVTGAVLGLVAAERADHPSRMVFKPVASIALLVVATTTGVTGRYGYLILVGLLLSVVGDLALLSTHRRGFVAGLTAFLLAHVAYTIAFLTLEPSASSTVVAAMTFFTVGAILGRWIMPAVPNDLRAPVASYMIAITAMVVTATALAADGRWMIAVGGLLFYVSDVAVARNQFIASNWRNKAWGLPTYYAGQTLLALSVAQTRL